MTEENKQNNVSEEYKYLTSMINSIHFRIDIIGNEMGQIIPLLENQLAKKSDTNEIISNIEKLIVHTCILRSSIDNLERRLGYLENRMQTALDQKKLNIWCLCMALMALFATLLVPIIKLTIMFIK